MTAAMTVRRGGTCKFRCKAAALAGSSITDPQPVAL
jgi:hypothetical protein